MLPWMGFVDDTITAIIDPDALHTVKTMLNSFLKNIQFTHEAETTDHTLNVSW